ncbi:MAG TPA: SRPBCC domain-containing protein, partial [Candidatus Binataceae bacterium]|nr:SRPBCC domain-containing protein [Candidatus Binataceae bacterium]
MEPGSSLPIETSERELVITRIFEAPRALVFKAWTDPEMQVQWLGPRGFTGKILKAAARPGDAYRYYMRDPQGGDHWQQGVVRELIHPERLVFTMTWGDERGEAKYPETLVTLTFEDLGGKTRMTLHQTGFESVNSRDQHREGWTS